MKIELHTLRDAGLDNGGEGLFLLYGRMIYYSIWLEFSMLKIMEGYTEG